jgi:DNA-binding NtrC family response regulator
MNDTVVLLLYPQSSFARQLCEFLASKGYRIEQPTNVTRAMDIINTSQWHLIIIDENWILHQQKLFDSFNLGKPVIVISSKGSVRGAVEMIRAGAYDYLFESSDFQIIQESIQRVLAKNDSNKNKTSASRNTKGAPIAIDEAMQGLLNTAQRIASSEATVLLQGESGTGKEVIARYIHNNSMRCNGPFVAINCAALPESLAESELFGFEKGAFTGAFNAKPGKFELAQNGTLLLDEISEMPLNLQPKLLRVLQERNISRIGGRQNTEVNARIVATTNRNLSQMVKENQFRQDLYYRLRVIPLKIPPLRDRPADIPLLIDHFISKFYDPSLYPRPVLCPEALERMLQWPWPGNVRELENTVERAILISSSSQIGPECLLLDDDLNDEKIAHHARLVGMTVRDLEKKLIDQTLSHVNQNRTHASQMLGISIRTLRNKLREYRDLENQPLKTAAR